MGEGGGKRHAKRVGPENVTRVQHIEIKEYGNLFFSVMKYVINSSF